MKLNLQRDTVKGNQSDSEASRSSLIGENIDQEGAQTNQTRPGRPSRGAKRKAVENGSDPEYDAGPKKKKRRPGRPPGARGSRGRAAAREEVAEEEEKGDATSNEESQNSQDAEDSSPRSSRRKGVPRKVVVPEPERNEDHEEETPVRRGRGRPKSTPQVTPVDKSDSDLGAATGSSRRRKARPPRRFHFDMEEDTEEAKRRAEKEAIINYAEFDHGNEDSPLPGAAGTRQLEEDEAERRKGRRLGPKRKPRAPKQEVSGPIICARCNQEFAALNQLKHHLMDKHTALWTAEHPEGETDAAAIRTIFKRLKKLNCRDCGKELKSTTYYNFHIKWCGREEETAMCPVCHKEKKSIWMYQHLRSHEKKEQAAEQAKVSLEKTKEEDMTGRRRSAAQKAMDNMHVLTEDLQDTESDVPRRRSAKVDEDVYIKVEDEADDEEEDIAEEKFSKSYSSEDRRRSGGGGGKPGVVPAVPDVFQEVLELELSSTPLQNFPQLVPWRSDWSPVPRREVEQHLPVYQESVQFQVTRGREKSSTKVLQWQEDYVDAHHVTVFVGGPVWALAWCPVPHAAWRLEEGAGQVLAVAAHRDMDHLHKTSLPQEGPALIQLYHFSALTSAIMLWGKGYWFRSRGEIEVKSKGVMRTYFLLGMGDVYLDEPDDEFANLPLLGEPTQDEIMKLHRKPSVCSVH